MSNPSLEEFLALPSAEVAAVAPETMIYAAGGTRRAAALAGLPANGNEYAQWAYQQMIESFAMFFEHGVKNIITHSIIPSQYAETTGNYREKLLKWVDWVLANPDALADYRRRGWRARLWGAENIPEVAPVAQKLWDNPAPPDGPRLIFTVTPTHEAPWTSLFDAVHRSGARTQAEAIRAQFGEDIPPVSLFICVGKPEVFPSIIPPALTGKVQCYWSQRPGFIMEPGVFRTVLYDYAYQRKTWQQDKTGRAEQALRYRKVWKSAPIIGLGMRMGPFWYPQPIAAPEPPEEE